MVIDNEGLNDFNYDGVNGFNNNNNNNQGLNDFNYDGFNDFNHGDGENNFIINGRVNDNEGLNDFNQEGINGHNEGMNGIEIQGILQNNGDETDDESNDGDEFDSDRGSDDEEYYVGEGGLGDGNGNGNDETDSGEEDGEEEEEEEEEVDDQEELLSSPLYEGSDWILKQTIHFLLQWKSNNMITISAFEEVLQLLHYKLLPQPNILPTSMYKCMSLLNLNISKYERHVCINDCYLFPHLEVKEYKHNLHQLCPGCEAPRFIKRGNSISPQKKFYYLPIREQIKNLKKIPGFFESFNKMKQEVQGGDFSYLVSFWGGSVPQDFVDHYGYDIWEQFSNTLLFSLGLDGVECFKNNTYSVWPVCLKLWNLHPEERTLQKFILFASLIPGPKPPKNFGPYLQPLFEEINCSQDGIFFFS